MTRIIGHCYYLQSFEPGRYAGSELVSGDGVNCLVAGRYRDPYTRRRAGPPERNTCRSMCKLKANRLTAQPTVSGRAEVPVMRSAAQRPDWHRIQ